MAYTRTTWEDGVTPVDASRLNNIESGVADHDCCMVTKIAAQTIATASYVAIAFDSELKDTATMHDNSTNPSRITVPSAGIYLVTGCVEFDLNAMGERVVAIRRNGTTVASNQNLGTGDIYDKVSISAIVECTAGQYIELFVWQNSGDNLDLRVVSAYAPTLSVIKLY